MHKVVLHLLVWAELAMFAVDVQCEGGGGEEVEESYCFTVVIVLFKIIGY